MKLWYRPGKLLGKWRFQLATLFWCAGCTLFAQSAINFQLTDDFASRPTFVAGSTIVGSLSNATIEVGEPFIEDVSSGQTAWGSWTAPADGIITLSPGAETFVPLLTVYTGEALTNLSLVASNNYLICYADVDCGFHWRERAQTTFHVAAGQAYQMCVDSAIITDASIQFQSTAYPGSFSFNSWGPVFTTNILEGGDFALRLQFTPAPANDDFIHRIKLSGSRIATHLSNAGATKEPGEPDHSGNPGGSSVWYSWTAPASGRITLTTNQVPPYAPPTRGSIGSVITTIGSPTCGDEIDQNPPPVFYPVFAAYTGTALASLTPADCLPMGLAAYPDAVEFDAVKGQTYQIAFDGNMGTTGEIPFYLELTLPPPNDNFNRRIPLHGMSVFATGYNAGATHQNGEPVVAGSSGKAVWWSWMAPASGVTSIDIGENDYAFPVAVFTGSNIPHLHMVAEGAASLSFNAVGGQTYQIAVSDDNGLTGAFRLLIQGPHR